jgi:type I restriction enzyme S subunit
MNSEWTLKPLASLAHEVTVGYVGPMADEYVAEGLPFLRSLNVSPFVINTNDLKFVTPEFHSKIKKSALRPGDVVIVRTGKPGTCAVIPEWLPDANCSDLVIARCGPELRPRFLCYWVNSVAAHHISSHLVGAVQQHFNVGAAKTMLVACPSLAEQDQIVSILGALDDRIALLRETNATLEDIARALFKSWFVDFDPVRARQQGLTPEGMDEATAALFPDGFEESELGVVPKGWEPIRLDSILELAYGKALKADARKLGDVPVYGSGGITGWHDAPLVNAPSVVVGRKGTVGSLYWESRPFFPIDTVFYVKTNKPLSYIYYLLQTLGLSEMNTDAAVPGLNRENVYRLKVPGATPKVIAVFDDVVHHLRASMDHNTFQAQTLATLRDTLLPRLISGQLRLPDAEAHLEEAAA